jgi:hypothetical protein
MRGLKYRFLKMSDTRLKEALSCMGLVKWALDKEMLIACL